MLTYGGGGFTATGDFCCVHHRGWRLPHKHAGAVGVAFFIYCVVCFTAAASTPRARAHANLFLSAGLRPSGGSFFSAACPKPPCPG